MWSLHRVRGQLEVYLARGLVGVGQKPGGHLDPPALESLELPVSQARVGTCFLCGL